MVKATGRDESAAHGTGDPKEEFSDKPFAVTLGEMLRKLQEDPVNNPLGRVNLTEFFDTVEGYDYNTLRKMTIGDRTLRPEAIIEIAKALSKQMGRTVKPEYFREYRMAQVNAMLEQRPELTDTVYLSLRENFGGEAPPFQTTTRPYHRKPPWEK